MIEIIPILSDSNCYLLKKNSGFILFDTGFKAKRKLIENSLEIVTGHYKKIIL